MCRTAVKHQIQPTDQPTYIKISLIVYWIWSITGNTEFSNFQYKTWKFRATSYSVNNQAIFFLFIYFLFLYLSKFIPESHIGGSSADIPHLSSTPMAIQNKTILNCSGVAVTFFKDRKTMLVGCAAKSIGSQSCTNRSRICRTSDWRRSMIF